MLVLLASHDNQLHNTVFKTFSNMLETQVCSQKVAIRDEAEFQKMHRVILAKIWGRYRNIFSNYKNNKICLVTFDEWQRVFSTAGFNKEFNSIPSCEKEIVAAIDIKSDVDVTLFTDFYKRLLCTFNKFLINLVFYQEMVNDREFTDKTSNAEDFALMMNSPWIYRHYNHSKGKFAGECCNRCKICRSSGLPTNFSDQLAEARKKMEIKVKFEKLIHLNEGSQEIEEQIISAFSTLLLAH